jgi:hypothetical protein
MLLLGENAEFAEFMQSPFLSVAKVLGILEGKSARRLRLQGSTGEAPTVLANRLAPAFLHTSVLTPYTPRAYTSSV